MSTEWVCSGCGKHLEDEDTARRRPCPYCNSLARTANESIREALNAQVYLKVHAKHRDGGTKVIREVVEGDDYHRKTGKWNVMRRIIDRANNWYEETFHDRETGREIHKTAEPLTDHKQKSKDKP